ncbi:MULTISPECIES: adaptor protein MecA [Alkalihalophilus]|uniref:Adapter protein MecA n=2 Tax=Alkalihalophilus pseudofirmus TaxID=79885 RepID=MECA_ALKPO|nr:MULTISPECIES: adaptor protein MecA [Alkalihalophilus]O66042.1 RecName: Full=Adapter protein MecA [Alkalihalophilus pseudofirmus OF4]AAC05443.1 MecA homolog [Cytobacillus firmus]ADC48448.1 adaptor protein, MecA [Alkalihalophilus pseudofirmus OF4]MDV2885629.1 adaptor protein MecA [Alkalihalophilus pseudofirmus]MEC2074325.1 adaptor protein MecA [Alkalihalophilus marmarensis]OLS39481.1 adaptor protein MecA [Alkalihalophilus pseudofirmus]
MDIERVNDTTIKFFITYKDIEDRGFDRDEIWYNRERGEELFFEMMNEANDRDEFELDGPLWIQVHALDKGLEIVVTRGQVSDGNVKLEIPVSQDKENTDENIVDLMTGHSSEDDEGIDTDQLEIVIGFNDFEDIISLSHNFFIDDLENELYHFEGRYYLHVLFNDDQYNEDEQDDMLSQMLEYGYETDLSIHRMQEYGKEIIGEYALKHLRGHFPQN